MVLCLYILYVQIIIINVDELYTCKHKQSVGGWVCSVHGSLSECVSDRCGFCEEARSLGRGFRVLHLKQFSFKSSNL